MSGDRLGLTVAMLLMVGLLYLLMLRGWRSRKRRQGDLPAPPAPPVVRAEALGPAVPGLFVGTTFSDDWLDRVAVHDLAHRAAGWLVLTTDGVHVEREGLVDLYLPYDAIEGASLGEALAGKVVGKEGLLLLEWRLGSRRLTSAFRADDHAQHRTLAEAVAARLPTRLEA
ncbi:MAG: integral rane protein [Frankiales bacterium]|nr:integral rane protein [Frankiales bacterium]